MVAVQGHESQILPAGRFVPHPGLRHGYHAYLHTAEVAGLFEAGEQWAGNPYAIPPHEHTCWELYLQLDGGASHWRVEDHEIAVGPLQALLVPPGTEHELIAPIPRRWHFCFVQLDPARILDTGDASAHVWEGPIPVFMDDASACRAPFALLMHHVATGGRLRAEALRTACRLLLITLAELATDGAGRPQMLHHPAIARAEAILRSRYAEPLRVADLAREVGLSVGYFTELFSVQTGRSPVAFRTAVRLEEAIRLLAESELGVAEIAQSTGFYSAQHLARALRTERGTTASQIRASVRGDRPRRPWSAA